MNKEAILDTSLDLIVDNGIENFSMRKLADILEVKPASIYYYFKTKEEILNDLFQECVSSIVEKKASSNYVDYEDHLYYFLEFVQSNRKKFFFVMKYRDNGFLNKESEEKINALFKQMIDKKELCNFKSMMNDVNGLILKGVVSELVFNPKHTFSEDQLKLLVKKIMKAFKEE